MMTSVDDYSSFRLRRRRYPGDRSSRARSSLILHDLTLSSSSGPEEEDVP